MDKEEHIADIMEAAGKEVEREKIVKRVIYADGKVDGRSSGTYWNDEESRYVKCFLENDTWTDTLGNTWADDGIWFGYDDFN